MNTLSMSYPPIWALSTRGAFPGRGTVMGWSSLLNSIGCSDQCKYYVVTGGDVTAKLTWGDMLFSSLFDFGMGCIIAVMCPLYGIYPPSLPFPWYGWFWPCTAPLFAWTPSIGIFCCCRSLPYHSYGILSSYGHLLDNYCLCILWLISCGSSM
jgi:hypothetical protein